MHYIGPSDRAIAQAVALPADHGQGFVSVPLVGREVGAVHTDLAVATLAPGGSVRAHLHSYESAVYVLWGRPQLSVTNSSYQLGPGDFALLPVGYCHAWDNPTADEARWLIVSTPQHLEPSAGRADTFFDLGLADGLSGGAATEHRAERPDPSNPAQRYFGHYGGTPPQEVALRTAGPVRGRAPAGMDTALLAYSGISVKMMVDRNLGAELLTMFMVDYEPGGAAQAHDHPFEEAYFFLAGEIEAEFEGAHYLLKAGDVAWAGVGAAHAFYNVGGGRVRWIETQAPQPPGRHSYRWVEPWKRLERPAAARQEEPVIASVDDKGAVGLTHRDHN